MPDAIRVRFSPLRGLDLSTAKIHMQPGAAQKSVNMDYEKPPGGRIRAGYARLLDGDSNVINVATSPSRIMAFERDDEGVRLLVAHGASMQEFTPGPSEWT